MARIFSGLGRPATVYDVGRLVDHRILDPYASSGGQHVVCDIDKTYLETDFESLTRMARIAFEDATDKITVAGAPEVLSYARWGFLDRRLEPQDSYPYHLHFVSSSPPQLRAVLGEKLTIDGLDWSSDTFKNQAYNLRMRRMDLLRQHIGYKSLAILNLIARAGEGSVFWMIGDNAESDPFIYLGIKLFVEGRIDGQDYGAYLRSGGLEDSVCDTLVALAKTLPKAEVARILIRCLPGYDNVGAKPWTDVICYFSDYFEAMLQLIDDDLLPQILLPDLVRRFHNRYGLDVQDMVGRAVQWGVCPTHTKDLPEWFQLAAAKVQQNGVAVSPANPKRLPEGARGEVLEAMKAWGEALHRSKLRRRGQGETEI